GREGIRRDPGAARFVLVDPRTEVLGCQARERQEEVRQVPLGIDGNRRDAVDGGFLDERQAQPGLAAAGHADAKSVGDQVPGVVEDRLAERAALRIALPAEVEDAKLLEVPHGTILFGALGIW